MNQAIKGKSERDYYQIVRDWLERRLKEKSSACHLEVTAQRVFSNALKAQIPRHREMIFHFLREAPPDITGFLKREGGTVEFVVVEVKKGVIRLDDIYQTRKYAELFDARYALLISIMEEVPEEIMRLAKAVPSLMHLPHWSQRFALVSLDVETGGCSWFPEDPFAKIPRVERSEPREQGDPGTR